MSCFSKTFLEQFAPVADSIRSLHDYFGTRPYKVFLVEERWTGSEIGEGEKFISYKKEIVPTPKVDGLVDVELSRDDHGRNHNGELAISQISSSYTEWDLMPHKEQDNVDFYIEVETANRALRGFPLNKPTWNVMHLGWEVTIQLQCPEPEQDDIASNHEIY